MAPEVEDGASEDTDVSSVVVSEVEDETEEVSEDTSDETSADGFWHDGRHKSAASKTAPAILVRSGLFMITSL